MAVAAGRRGGKWALRDCEPRELGKDDLQSGEAELEG